MSVENLGAQAVLSAVQSKAQATGYFQQVLLHEPDNAPPAMGAAIWVDTIVPVKSSGLISSSVLLVVMLRMYGSAMQEPKDTIEPSMVAATDVLMADLHSDFQLGGLTNLRAIDLLGSEGVRLSAQAGYVNSQEMTYRVVTLTIPMIFNDLWTQAA